MERAKNWDFLSIAAAVLCVGPEVVTSLHLGLPTDLAWWEWLTVVPVVALLLGTPQLTMLAYIRAAQSTALRFAYLAASVGMLGYYYHRLATGDLSSSSTAAVGLFFVAFYMAFASAVAGALLLWIDRLLLGSRKA